MAKNSKVKEVSVSTHNGNHFITVVRERADSGKRMRDYSNTFCVEPIEKCPYCGADCHADFVDNSFGPYDPFGQKALDL